MSRCAMFFCPKYISNTKYALKYPNHHLFIELRASSKMSDFFVKIWNFKHISPPFCIITNEFRRLKFNKTFII